MKRTLLSLALACLVAGALASDVRGGEDDDASTAVWVFEVRVVRVDTRTPEVTESAAPWETEGSTITTPWSGVLEQLKARGATTLLLDQRVTALAGQEAVITQSRDRQIKQFSNSDFKNERWTSAPIVTGCTAKLLTTPAGTLTYDVEARWVTESETPSWRPVLSHAKWHGAHPALEGRTLVLSYREQVAVEGGLQGVEIYAFVTGRHLK